MQYFTQWLAESDAQCRCLCLLRKNPVWRRVSISFPPRGEIITLLGGIILEVTVLTYMTDGFRSKGFHLPCSKFLQKAKPAESALCFTVLCPNDFSQNYISFKNKCILRIHHDAISRNPPSAFGPWNFCPPSVPSFSSLADLLTTVTCSAVCCGVWIYRPQFCWLVASFRAVWPQRCQYRCHA